MGWLPSFLQPIADFLNITLIDKSWIFISVWSIAHLIVGGLVYYLARRNGAKRPFLAAFLILLIWEGFEIFMFDVLYMFIPETIQDTIWDMVIGVWGAIMVWLYLDHN